MARVLTHWGRVTHICVSNLTIISSDNGLSPGRRLAIIYTNAGILSVGPLGTNFNEISIGIQTFSFKKMHFKMSSAKWRLFCLGLNVLRRLYVPILLGAKGRLVCFQGLWSSGDRASLRTQLSAYPLGYGNNRSQSLRQILGSGPLHMMGYIKDNGIPLWRTTTAHWSPGFHCDVIRVVLVRLWTPGRSFHKRKIWAKLSFTIMSPSAYISLQLSYRGMWNIVTWLNYLSRMGNMRFYKIMILKSWTVRETGPVW